jgi:acyl carrier protein
LNHLEISPNLYRPGAWKLLRSLSLAPELWVQHRMTATLPQINGVFRDLFDDEELHVGRDTTAADVAGWDSLMHVRLMLELEKVFRVRFLSSEVASMKNVGELVDLIDAKTRQ